MPVLAKVSWQIGQLAFKITLQLMKQISFRQVISPAQLLLALSPRAESILHNQDCAFRAWTSNSSCLLNARLSITSYSHSCHTQGVLKAQNSKLSPVAYDKKKLQRPTGTKYFSECRWWNTNINQKSEFTTAENQSLSRSIDMFSDTKGSHTKHHATLLFLVLLSTINNHP